MIQSNLVIEPQVLSLFDHQTNFILTVPQNVDCISFQNNSNIALNDKRVPNNHYIHSDSSEFLGSSINNEEKIVSSDSNLSDYPNESKTDSKSSLECSLSQRKKFSPEEDMKLCKIVALHGPHKWDEIALLMPGRTGRQCRDRFHNYLNPTLVNGPWSKEEDKLLEQKVYELGQHWNKIVKFFRGRSENNIKNRWYTYVSKKKQGRFRKKISFSIREKSKKREYNDKKEKNSNKFTGNFFDGKSNFDRNIHNGGIDSFNNDINSIALVNENNYYKEQHKNELDSWKMNQKFEVLSNETKLDKKVFYPPICPPKNSSIWSFNKKMFDFLG